MVATGADAAQYLPKPGWFAGAPEKRYRAGLVAYLNGERRLASEAFEDVVVADATIVSAHLMAALSIEADAELPRVIHHLEAVVTTEAAFPDRLMVKFLPPQRTALEIGVRITELIQARVPFDRVGATLLLAEAYQEAGRLEEAIGLVQQLHQANAVDPAIRLSLADLLFADGDFDAVVEIAAGIRNDDDLSLSLIHLRGAALLALGHQAAAFDAFRDALAKTANRDRGLLATIRYDRALAYERVGQRGRARADFERLFAADPDYRDVRAKLSGT